MKILDLVFKILSALVIPLLLWGVSLEVRLAVQATKMLQVERDLVATEGVKKAVQDNAVAFARLEEQFRAANQSLTEIKGLLDHRP